MKYTEFLHTIETEITARLDNDFKLTIHPVKKNNGMIYDGLVIIYPKFNIAPTIYLNPYYHWYLDGVSIDSILDAILSTYNDFKPTEDFDISFCDDFSKVKEKIIFQLISYDKNQKQLKDMPYIKYLDFAIIFEVYVGAELPEFGRCPSVTLGHRYRNTNPRLNAKYPKDTSMLNNQHGRVSCQKMSGLCQSDARSL